MGQTDPEDDAGHSQGDQRRDAEHPGRRQHENITQMAPAVAPRAKVRCAITQVLRKRGRNLGHFDFQQSGLDHHFAGEFHARSAQLEIEKAVLANCAQAAMGIADPRSEEQVEHPGQAGIADMLVFPRHRTRRDPALEAVAHAQVIAFVELGDHRHAFGEVVAAIAIAHHDVTARRRRAAADQRRAIAAVFHRDDARAQFGRQRLAAIGRSIVRNHDLAAHAQFRAEQGKGIERVRDAMRQAFGFVKTWHDDGHVWRDIVRRLTALGKSGVTGVLKIHDGPRNFCGQEMAKNG